MCGSIFKTNFTFWNYESVCIEYFFLFSSGDDRMWRREFGYARDTAAKESLPSLNNFLIFFIGNIYKKERAFGKNLLVNFKPSLCRLSDWHENRDVLYRNTSLTRIFVAHFDIWYVHILFYCFRHYLQFCFRIFFLVCCFFCFFV